MNDCAYYREEISMMLDGELPEARKADLLLHIQACGECRAVYDAFAFISASLGEALAEPPADLCADVMASVRASAAAPRPTKKHGIILRMVSLAACFALIVFASSGIAKLPNRTGGAPESEAALRSAPDEPDAVYYSADNPSENKGAGVGLQAAEFAIQNQSKTPEAMPEGQESSLSIGAALYAGGDESASTSSVSRIEIIPSTTLVPAATITDEQPMTYAMELLEISETPEVVVSIEGDPTYTVLVTNDDSSEYEVEVWVVDSQLCCKSSLDNVTYIASGDASQLITLIEGS